MSDEREKLLIRIGQNFEANATGKLAIIVVFGVFCIAVVSALI